MIPHHVFKAPARVPMVARSIPRRQTMTREQITLRRHEDWRVAFEEGIPNERGVIERRPVALIAAIYGVTPQAVRDGIRRAKAVRALIQERIAELDGELAAG